MKSFKKIATSFYLIIFSTIYLTACQSSPLTPVDVKKPLELHAQSVKGATSNSFYKTESQVVVLDKKKVSRKYKEFAEFNIKRKTLHVNEKGQVQYLTTTSDKKGNMTLTDLAFPEPGNVLYEMIDKFGQPVVVKDYPIGSVFYLPKVALPKTKVKPGDEWSYKGRWISQDTGWPFELNLISKLKEWSSCEGTLCAIVTFTGFVKLPEDFPLESQLTSEIKGQYYYTPFSNEILWGVSESNEVFKIDKIQKVIRVKSQSCSHKLNYSASL